MYEMQSRRAPVPLIANVEGTTVNVVSPESEE
jgi:hypothetical protein